MARHRLSTAFTLLAGGAGGFLVAVLLQDPGPAPAPTPDAAPAASGGNVFQRTPPSPTVPAGIASAPASLAEILRIEGDFEQTAALYELLRNTDMAELLRLIDEAARTVDGSDRRAALSILYGRFADLDPRAALAALLQRGGSYDQVEVRALFHTWSRDDLDAAVAAAAGLPTQMQAAAGVTILLAREDLSGQAQRGIARRLGIEHALAQIDMRRVLDQVDNDPAAAWQAALAEGDTAQNQQRLNGIVHAWARQDPAAAMAAVTGLSNMALRLQLQHQVIGQWGGQDAGAAVNWALSQAPSAQRTQLMATALSAMAENEPRLAFDIGQSLSGQERAEVLGRVLSRWAQDDPAAAARSATMISEPGVRNQAIFGIASAYASRDPQGALEWLSELDPAESAMAVSIVFHQLTQTDPVQAGSLLNRLSDEATRANAAATVASVWAQQDPRAAARWTESLIDDDMRRRATADLLHAWAMFDRDEALRYAQNLTLAAERDAAVVAVMQVQNEDTDLNERLFESLTDPAQRQVAASLLYFTLTETDPARAERYREIAGMPAEHRGPAQ